MKRGFGIVEDSCSPADDVHAAGKRFALKPVSIRSFLSLPCFARRPSSKTWILTRPAAQFRGGHGMRLRIATKYHRLVREFLRERGVADYRLVDSQGATEGTVKNETAEAIADITSTGETLRANGLKVLEDVILS